MSRIIIREEKDEIEEKEWESLHEELRDPSLWKEANPEVQSEIEKVKGSLAKNRPQG